MIPTPKLHDIADLSLRCRLQTGMIGLALPLLLVCTSIPSAALAGVCTKSSRTCCAFTEKKARTTVENQSSSMTILAELNRDDSQKWEKYIHPGEKAEFTARFARMSGGRAVLTLQLYPDPGIRSSECKYYVVAGENYLDWRLPDGASEVCPDIGDMKIACDKTFNQSKARYTTTFTIGDPE